MARLLLNVSYALCNAMVPLDGVDKQYHSEGEAGPIRGMLLVSLQYKPTYMCEGLKAHGITFGGCKGCRVLIGAEGRADAALLSNKSAGSLHSAPPPPPSSPLLPLPDPLPGPSTVRFLGQRLRGGRGLSRVICGLMTFSLGGIS